VPTLYVVCAAGEFEPYLSWVDEAWEVVASSHVESADWRLAAPHKGDSQSSFSGIDVYRAMARDLGPVLYIGGLKSSAIAALESELRGRVVSYHCKCPAGSTDVYEAMLDVIARHHRNEPEVPRRFAVALMLVAKLERMHYWGGNAKGFMSVHKLAKSNGLDQKYADTAHEVAEYLASSQRPVRLLSSKLGDGYPKYACNNESRSVVYDFLRNRRVDDDATMRWLMRDSSKVSERELDGITPEQYADSR
jgi:hypothetical protein